ncbi:MAG: alpha-L-rhamnosidase C-terminal domain-containing protein, partial [Victivallaceae bacterium]|nr:alpha-L-rhamnosidase C-terminal domain-containing protein [Victivallaceae bacterium]
CFVHNSFESVGELTCDNPTVNALAQCTLMSFLGNFTGFPTDCPHREKNGWTGDAQLACETGLWSVKASRAYGHFVRNLADAQRVSGQLPGIVPTSGWGYNWGNGTAWDSALIEIPYQVYRFTGEDSAIKKNFDAMRRYIEFLRTMAEEDILSFGLGDWCHVDRERMAPVPLTSTGFYYSDVVRMEKFSRLLGFTDEALDYQKLAGSIRRNFLQKFHHGDGKYADNCMTSLAAPVYFGLAEESTRNATVRKLAELVEKNEYRADFGILGAKFVPRVLADHGYAEHAFRLITQKKFPGWGHWIERGATTLWENWDGSGSQTHIMFGDILAWMYEYLGGVSPTIDGPGFAKFTVRPNPVEEVHEFRMSHLSPYGEIVSAWKCEKDQFKLSLTVPSNTVAELTLPNQQREILRSGTFEFNCKVPR